MSGCCCVELTVDEGAQIALEVDGGSQTEVGIAEKLVVSGGGIIPVGTKTINVTENGTTSTDVTNYATAQVVANVPNSYDADDEGKVVDDGALVSQTSATYTANNTYDTTTVSSVTVAVSGGSPSGTKSISITENGTTTEDVAAFADAEITVAVPASAVVSGTKSITTNGTHDVTDYASAAVAVPASAVDSGTKAITTNGTHDVIGYASANVAVPASEVDDGTKNITTNGTHDVIGYASAEVDVPASEVVSGTKSITTNGTHDVTEYASANVAVPASAVDTGTKSISITTNGTTTEDVTGYASAGITVAVPASAVDTGTKSISITANGTTTEDVTGYANAEITVNVSGGGGGAQAASGTVTFAQDYTSGNVEIVTLADIGFTPTRFVFCLSDYSDGAANYMVRSSFETLGGTSYPLKVLVRFNSSGNPVGYIAQESWTTSRAYHPYCDGTTVYYIANGIAKIISGLTYCWYAYA